jgi:uncharacterized protein
MTVVMGFDEGVQGYGTVVPTSRCASTAPRVAPGHPPRVHISSGAHPHFARNPSARELLDELAPLLVAEQWIFPDPRHPEAALLPIPETSV